MDTLHRLATASMVASLLGILVFSNAHAVTIDWVMVGNPGNANDQVTGNVYGGVAYDYQIAKYEVTIQQYADFLNAVAKSDPYSLYSPGMNSPNVAGISQSGTSGGYAYSVIGPSGTNPAGASSPGNRPIAYVTWFSAARFANWMQNGQGSGSTETGAYTLNGATSGTAPAKNPGAQFYVPTENEWYKAAYYSPLLNSGSGGYYTYATQSNGVPGNTTGSGANQVNYYDGDFTVTQSPSSLPTQNYLTDVGAFTNSASYYGTFDQNGNVFEWAGSVARGGDAMSRSNYLLSSSRGAGTPGVPLIGFRLAAPVPEPSTCIIALAGLACGGYSMLRRRKRA